MVIRFENKVLKIQLLSIRLSSIHRKCMYMSEVYECTYPHDYWRNRASNPTYQWNQMSGSLDLANCEQKWLTLKLELPKFWQSIEWKEYNSYL